MIQVGDYVSRCKPKLYKRLLRPWEWYQVKKIYESYGVPYAELVRPGIPSKYKNSAPLDELYLLPDNLRSEEQ